MGQGKSRAGLAACWQECRPSQGYCPSKHSVGFAAAYVDSAFRAMGALADLQSWPSPARPMCACCSCRLTGSCRTAILASVHRKPYVGLPENEGRKALQTSSNMLGRDANTLRGRRCTLRVVACMHMPPIAARQASQSTQHNTMSVCCCSSALSAHSVKPCEALPAVHDAWHCLVSRGEALRGSTRSGHACTAMQPPQEAAWVTQDTIGACPQQVSNDTHRV